MTLSPPRTHPTPRDAGLQLSGVPIYDELLEHLRELDEVQGKSFWSMAACLLSVVFQATACKVSDPLNLADQRPQQWTQEDTSAISLPENPANRV